MWKKKLLYLFDRLKKDVGTYEKLHLKIINGCYLMKYETDGDKRLYLNLKNKIVVFFNSGLANSDFLTGESFILNSKVIFLDIK